MGLRAASVRHPNAVVMAPALTEAGQSKNFTLPPSSSPINSVSNIEKDGFNSSNDDDSQMCKTDLKIKRAYQNGQIDVTNTNYTTPVAKNQLQVASDNYQQPPAAAAVAAAAAHLNIIMSTCPTSMGDEDNTMGLQKTGMDIAMTSLLKDKTMPNDVEQLLNNLSALPAVDIGAGDAGDGDGDLTQNVDDLMQAWNENMESVNAERGQGDNNGDGNVETESETIFPIAFERELFSEVDMINMCEDDNLCQSQTAAKEHRAKETLDELQRKQVKLERRTEFILRRIRKLQIRHMGHHCGGEVAGLYEFVHRTLRRAKDTSTSTSVSSELNDHNNALVGVPCQPQDSILDLPSTSRAETPPQPICAATVNNLVRKLHLSAIQQSNTLHRQKHVAKYFGSGSSEQVPLIPAVRHPAPGTVVVPRFFADARDEIERVAGTLQTGLLAIERQIDSDATASSSGAESCDEMQSYNNQHQNYLSISKRAAWRYANERAQVASRWTWLQAQISDLEYRIRQYNELHRQIRTSKGTVSLGDSLPSPHRTCTSTNTSPMSPSAVNGYRGQLPGATAAKTSDDPANGAVAAASTTTTTTTSPGCSRTRPLHRASFRKRKLLQTTGLHTVSKKASRPANLRCGCVPPTVPCALCTGRTDPTFPRDCVDQLTVPERIALLDPGFHPVLSFPDDISQSIHLESIMKLPEWQQKSLRCNLKTLKGMAKAERAEKLSTGTDGRPKKSEHRKKYNRIIKSELKNKMGRGRRPFRTVGIGGGGVGNSGSSGGGGGAFRIKKRHTAKMAMAQLNALTSESMDELEMEAMSPAALGTKGDASSLTPSPLSHVQAVPYRRNRSVDSYDIDNIVIPYSVAAATRVEKLQYKEILTPKWRIIDSDFPAKYDLKNNGIVRRVSEDSDNEDVSEETICSRHDKCEHEEKKKFLSYIKFPLTGGRSRANRRTDSRAESSGANTPDPQSPHNNNNNNNNINNATMAAVTATATTDNTTETTTTIIGGSPLTSPPATPVSMLLNNEDASVSAASALRRRTVSQSRWAAHNREESRCPSPPDNSVEAVAPYEARLFPLPEELYDKMLKSMPEGHPLPGLFNKQMSRDSDANQPDSRADTPISDSTESAIAEEDPNDPEWVDVERVRDRTKR